MTPGTAAVVTAPNPLGLPGQTDVYNDQNASYRRTTSSPEFYDSVRKNNETAQSKVQMGHDLAAVNSLYPSLPMGAAAAPAVPSPYGAPTMGTVPGVAQGPPSPKFGYPGMLHNGTGKPGNLPGAPSVMDKLPLQSPDPTKARASIIMGQFGTPGRPPEDYGSYAASEGQRIQQGESQRARGLGGDIRPPEFRPRDMGTPETESTAKQYTVDYNRPAQQQSSPDRIAAEAEVRAAHQDRVAGINNPETPLPPDARLYKQQAAGQVDLAEQQAEYERRRAQDTVSASKTAGQSTQSRDTTLDNISRNYQAALKGRNKEDAARWEKAFQDYHARLNGDGQGQSAAQPAVGMGDVKTAEQQWDSASPEYRRTHSSPGFQNGTPKGGTSLDQNQAQQFLDQAGGDKTKARELARAAGFAL